MLRERERERESRRDILRGCVEIREIGERQIVGRMKKTQI